MLVMLSPHGRWKTVDMICFLIENGADVYARNRVGDSVLRVVLESLDGLHDSDMEIVELLLAYGCDPFEANSSGKTPLLIARERGLYFVESRLLSLGASASDVGGWHKPRDLDVGRKWISCQFFLLLFTCILASAID